MKNKLIIYLCFFVLLGSSCKNHDNQNEDDQIVKMSTITDEKKAILETLNNETKAAFQRDYQTWTKYWIHDSSITKTYLDFRDDSFSESVGWKDISGFVKTFIEEHPEPEPVPELLAEIDLRLYEGGAWVTYEQMDNKRGRKRETRLMEKVDGKWKIAGMQTTIYRVDQ